MDLSDSLKKNKFLSSLWFVIGNLTKEEKDAIKLVVNPNLIITESPMNFVFWIKFGVAQKRKVSLKIKKDNLLILTKKIDALYKEKKSILLYEYLTGHSPKIMFELEIARYYRQLKKFGVDLETSGGYTLEIVPFGSGQNQQPNLYLNKTPKSLKLKIKSKAYPTESRIIKVWIAIQP